MNPIVTLPKFTFFSILLHKPIIGLTTMLTVVATVNVVSMEKARMLLNILFVVDFATGLLASYFTWKKSTGKKDKWFFGTGKGLGFSSDKFKKMFVKGSVYLGFPLLLVKFQETFYIKNIKYETISDAELEIATICIIIFCLNEGYSIFHENLPKCGFNIFKIIRDLIKIKDEFKTNKDE